MNRLVRFSPLLSLTLALLPSACAVTPGDAPDEDGALASAQPIINGTVSDPVPVGVVLVQSSAGLCSGTLLSNRWVVSARHCFDASAATSPSSVSITLGAQVRAAAEVILHQGRDVALVRLDLPMVMNNSTTGWDRSFFAGPLVGRAVRCMGYGRNTYNGGSGTFRVANLQVTGTSGEDFVVSPNGAGQVPWMGDSGGPCMVTMPDGRQMIAGVASTASHSASSQQVFSARYLAAPFFREWAAESRVPKELIARHSGRCLEARNAVITNAFAEQRACDGGADQRWRFDAAGTSALGDLFRLRDAASGKCLTVSSLQGGDGTPMTVMPCGQSDAQRFLLDDMGGGFRRVRNVFTNKCLDVPSSSQVDGARLQQSACHNGANQQFALRVHMEDGVHEVTGVGSAKCLDIPNASLAPQTRLQQSMCNLQTNQEFRFEEVANGEFRVRPKHSNLCLDIADASTADHGVVQQFTCHSGTNQRFRLLYQSGGVYQLQGVGSGRCIDVPDASTANGVFLQQSLCHSGSNQRWRMRL